MIGILALRARTLRTTIKTSISQLLQSEISLQNIKHTHKLRENHNTMILGLKLVQKTIEKLHLGRCVHKTRQLILLQLIVHT